LSNMIKLKTYKNVDLNYNESDGQIYFEFEGVERRVAYVFEAQRIIDEPVWEECELYGYFVDGYIDRYIGLARAVKKDIKSGRPYWLFKGQYDTDFKSQRFDTHTVYLKTEENDRIYREWNDQRIVYQRELGKLNSITKKLRNCKIKRSFYDRH